jgi:hypothetical protein
MGARRKIDDGRALVNDPRVRPLESASVSALGVSPPPPPGTDADSSGQIEAALRAVLALERKMAEQRATLDQLKLVLLRLLVLPPGAKCSVDELHWRMSAALRRLERAK